MLRWLRCFCKNVHLQWSSPTEKLLLCNFELRIWSNTAWIWYSIIATFKIEHSIGIVYILIAKWIIFQCISRQCMHVCRDLLSIDVESVFRHYRSVSSHNVCSNYLGRIPLLLNSWPIYCFVAGLLQKIPWGTIQLLAKSRCLSRRRDTRSCTTATYSIFGYTVSSLAGKGLTKMKFSDVIQK